MKLGAFIQDDVRESAAGVKSECQVEFLGELADIPAIDPDVLEADESRAIPDLCETLLFDVRDGDFDLGEKVRDYESVVSTTAGKIDDVLDGGVLFDVGGDYVHEVVDLPAFSAGVENSGAGLRVVFEFEKGVDSHVHHLRDQVLIESFPVDLELTVDLFDFVHVCREFPDLPELCIEVIQLSREGFHEPDFRIDEVQDLVQFTFREGLFSGDEKVYCGLGEEGFQLELLSVHLPFFDFLDIFGEIGANQFLVVSQQEWVLSLVL